MLGYKHTAEAIAKIKLRFVDKTNHPMYGKNHTPEALKAISKPGELNPMFNKSHNAETTSPLPRSMIFREIYLEGSRRSCLPSINF
jgi:hypothetical protein